MKVRLISMIFIILTLQIQALDICNNSNEDDIILCRNILKNQKNINSSNKKVKLKSIVFLARKLVFLKENDYNTIVKILDGISTYASIFSNKNVFITIAEKCKSKNKVYIVEAYFDHYYNVKFIEKKVSKIRFSNNNCIIDSFNYKLTGSNFDIYYNTLQKFAIHKKVIKNNIPEIIEEENNNICTINAGNKPVIVRDDRGKKITKLKNNEKVELVPNATFEAKGIVSYLVRFKTKSGKQKRGYVNREYLKGCY